ncbi:MAG: AAA family ATPase [Betaproteobacteria bacterium]|nr:AAA family ATPase [Betaproteobacteria bacterium]
MDAMAPRRGADSNGAAERVVNQLLTEMDGLEGRGSVFLVAATNRPDMLDPALLRPGRLDKLLYVPLPDEAGRVSILHTLLQKVPSVSRDVDACALAADPRCARFSGADLAALVREACVAALRERLSAPPGAGAPHEGRAAGEGATTRGGLDEKDKGSAERSGGMATDVLKSSEGGPSTGGLDPALTGNGSTEEAGPERRSSKAIERAICVQRRHFETALQRVRPSVSSEDLEHYEQVKDAIHGARGHVGTM